ncbi:MAG TPA: BTAD domain-containing putative transcriptional regulator [Actinocrinis sp.]|nr:BTAD domain-containing putative transcriptional regulator [Actinocrinis sp.]
MEISILGPLVLRHAGGGSAPTAPKPRSALGLLLLNADQTVQGSSLIRDLWGSFPPTSAVTTLQTYILQIRKSLARLLGVSVAEVSRELLVTVPGGYELRAASADFDRREFDRLAATGRSALSQGDNLGAAAALSRACALWRGPALADVRPGVVAEAQLRALEQTRLTTLEQSIDARMRLGHHQDVLPELTLLVAEHGLNENLCAQLMVALHRSGRRREALYAFHQLRGSMVAELGLEPSKRLHLLQQAVLSDDPSLEVPPRDDGLIQLLDHLVGQRARAL